ncbi:hypothetical protein DPMN_084419 [Dreissena polymorpha]|uniref:Uncharacterized protein n=1 Tax=Dreissena polymorpha TaxID=45954 RepID=A0A9D4BJ86_DREPO|nr:hypothetical protein DPMN_084419 [Dreissena polymorpha]
MAQNAQASPVTILHGQSQASQSSQSSQFYGSPHLAGADRSSIFFLKVKGLSFSITKEGGVE